MQVASDAAAGLGGNPKVGAACVQHNLEGLGRGTDGDFREVCEVISSLAFVIPSIKGGIDLH